MAKWQTACVGSLFSLTLAFGCQQNKTSMVSNLPAPSFDAPRILAPRPVAPVVAVAPSVVPTLPKLIKPVAPASKPQIAVTGPREWMPEAPLRAWKWIVIHHSATTTGGAAAFDKMHRAKGWDELGYDFVIGNGTDTPDGQIEVGPRWTKQKIGAHAKTPDNRFNEFGVGICLVGNFEVEKPTPKQLASLEKLCGYLMKNYHISPTSVMGHRDTKSTECPGRYLYNDVAMITRKAALLAGANPLSDSTNTQAAIPASELLVPVSR